MNANFCMLYSLIGALCLGRCSGQGGIFSGLFPGAGGGQGGGGLGNFGNLGSALGNFGRPQPSDRGLGNFGRPRPQPGSRDNDFEYPWDRRQGRFTENEMCDDHLRPLRCPRQTPRDRVFCEDMLFSLYWTITDGFSSSPRAGIQGAATLPRPVDKRNFWLQSPSAAGNNNPGVAQWHNRGPSRQNRRRSREEELRHQVCNFLYYYNGARRLCCEQLDLLCGDMSGGRGGGRGGGRRRDSHDSHDSQLSDSRDGSHWSWHSGQGRGGESGHWSHHESDEHRSRHGRW